MSKIDFSNHVVEIIQHEGVLIHRFKKPNTVRHNLTFINTCGTMTVTGDFGNWVFCREFHPSPIKETLSRGYMDEKLQIHSVQKSRVYDTDETKRLIQEFRNEYCEDDDCNELTEWVDLLEDNVYDEFDYKHVAYREKPEFVDYEDVPFGEIRHRYLETVYDGFEALCLKLLENE